VGELEVLLVAALVLALGGVAGRQPKVAFPVASYG
jgi:hypothetical protein